MSTILTVSFQNVGADPFKNDDHTLRNHVAKTVGIQAAKATCSYSKRMRTASVSFEFAYNKAALSAGERAKALESALVTVTEHAVRAEAAEEVAAPSKRGRPAGAKNRVKAPVLPGSVKLPQGLSMTLPTSSRQDDSSK
jgi:hypothetical protein